MLATPLGVQQLDHYKSCLQCKARVEPLSPPMGQCTKEDGQMMQLFDLCPNQITALILLHYVNNDDQYDIISIWRYGVPIGKSP